MNKIKIVLFSIIGFWFLTPFIGFADEIVPNKDFYIYDNVGILTNEDKQEIISKNKEYEKTKEKPQIVMVITKDNIDVDSEAPKIFERFKIGNKELDNGLLIIYSEPEKKIIIEVGYGLEGAIPDATAGEILDYNLSNLKSTNVKDVRKGLLETFRATSSLIDTEYDFEFSNYETPDYISDDSEEISFPVVIVIIVATISWVILFFINPDLALDILFILLRVLASSSSSSSSGSSSRGGGGRSGGGGASR